MKTHTIAFLLSVWFSACGIAVCGADVITLTSGRVIHGTILQTEGNNLLILADYGTTSVPTNIVDKIEQEADKHPTTLSVNTLSADGRIPEWKTIMVSLASKSWADKLRQIPATVITNGVLKNVPYISFRCGIDYEVNIYGDLDNPAGIEVGLYRSLLPQKYAKDNVVNFVASILQKQGDRDIVKSLNREKDAQREDGVTLEITPPTAEDAYGGWWVSVYNEKALEQARVTDKELESISILNSAVIKEPDPVNTGLVWTKDDLRYARPAVAVQPTPAQNQPQTQYSSTSTSFYPDVAPEHNHGSVYVHSYYRKNGTFVSSYTRRR